MFNGLSASASLARQEEGASPRAAQGRKESKLYNYLNKNCKWLLLPLTGHTNLVTDSLKNFISLNDNITIKASKNAGVSGCYIFMLSKEQENQEYICYIGSATDLNTRYKIHKTNSTRSSKKKKLRDTILCFG